MKYSLKLKREFTDLFEFEWYLEVLDENAECVGYIDPIDPSVDSRDLNDYHWDFLNEEALQEALNEMEWNDVLERRLIISDVDGVTNIERVEYPSTVFRLVDIDESTKLEVIEWFKSGSRKPLYFHRLTSLHVV